MSPIGIVGLGSAVPPKIVTNEDLIKMGVDTSDEWVRTRSGIEARRFVDKGQATSDLALQASKKAIENAGLNPGDIDLIIVATCTPDYLLFPSVACMLQNELGISQSKIPAFDISAACTGFIYALKIGQEFIKGGSVKNVLVVGADVYSPFLNWKDRTTCVLFGDGAGAVVLSEIDKDKGLLAITINADGSGKDLMGVKAGGSKCEITPKIIEAGENKVFMNGKQIFKWATNIIVDSIEKTLQMCELKKEDIDLFIAHQANIRIIDYACKKLNLSQENVYVNISKYGNTSAASIPLALDEAWQMNKLKEDMIVAIVGFGAGLTYGAGIIKWSKGRL